MNGEEKKISIWSILSGALVVMLAMGLVLTLLMSPKANAEETIEAVPATKVTLIDEVSTVTIIDAGPAYSCEINVKGDSPWSLGVLLAAAKQIEGCKIFVDPTPLVFYTSKNQ